jgi:DNA-directed RNA polymerase beta' subunit
MVDTKVAKEIRIQEVVTLFNIQKIQEIVARELLSTENSTITRIIRGSGSFVISKDTKIMLGDVFERDLQDGDYVSYNRSPSLLPTYMAGFRVRITTENVDTI